MEDDLEDEMKEARQQRGEFRGKGPWRGSRCPRDAWMVRHVRGLRGLRGRPASSSSSTQAASPRQSPLTAPEAKCHVFLPHCFARRETKP